MVIPFKDIIEFGCMEIISSPSSLIPNSIHPADLPNAGGQAGRLHCVAVESVWERLCV